MTIAFEVSDVCFKVVDWDCEDRNYASSYYFMLLEEIGRVAKEKHEYYARLQMGYEQLVRRYDQAENKISNQYTRNLALLSLSKFWQPSSEEDLTRIISTLRVELFSTDMLGFIKATMSAISAQSIEFLLAACMHFVLRYSSQTGEIISGLLTQFCEVVDNSAGNSPILDLSQKILGIINRYQAGELFVADEFSILLEKKNFAEFEANESSFYDYLHAALNIFNKQGRRHETLNGKKPMELLKMTAVPKEMN